MLECASKEGSRLEFVPRGLGDLSDDVTLRCRTHTRLPSRNLKGSVVVGELEHLVILTLDHLRHSPHSHIEITLLAHQIRRANQGLTHIRNRLIPQVMPHRRLGRLALLELQIRIPGPPIKGLGAHVLGDVAVDGAVEEVLVADEEHALDVVLELVAVGGEREQGDGGGHFQKAVAEEFEAFVVVAHAGLEVDLLFAMVACVVAVFGEGFESKGWGELQVQEGADVESDEC